MSCTGSARACDDLADFGRTLSLIVLSVLIILYGAMSVLAFFAKRRSSKTLTAILLALELIVVVGSVVSIANADGNTAAVVSGSAGFVTGALCIVLAGWALRARARLDSAVPSP